ncbi:MAG: hypothetical protein QME05_00650 [Candidatus Margulisbacteria bacterium]|nr:hypothetical protein [Candidatus Margulisiibacteriota bacterium]
MVLAKGARDLSEPRLSVAGSDRKRAVPNQSQCVSPRGWEILNGIIQKEVVKMNAKMLKDELISDIEELPVQDLKIIIEFVDFIKEKELEEEMMNSKKIIKAVKRSQKDWEDKKLSKFVSLEELKKKYSLR